MPDGLIPYGFIHGVWMVSSALSGRLGVSVVRRVVYEFSLCG